MRHFFAIILLIVGMTTAVLADPVGMVVKVLETGEISVNRGVEDQVQPGTHWYVYRDKKPIAELEVMLVDDYSSEVKVVSGGNVRVGDVVSNVPFTQAPDAKDYAPDTVNTNQNSTYHARHRTMPSRRPETQESVQEKYADYLSKSTKVNEFSGGNSKARKTTANLPQIANLALLAATGSSTTPGLVLQQLGGVVPQEFSYNAGAKDFFKGCKLKVETTFWGEELTNAYADTICFQEGRTDPQERVIFRSNMLGQKGLDRYLVFHVKITNCGTGNVQLEPFHWHMFLIDNQGNRVKTERYDQILDKTLAPEQVVEGNVYFFRYDTSGNDLAAGADIKIMYEDVMAERAEVEFSNRLTPPVSGRVY